MVSSSSSQPQPPVPEPASPPLEDRTTPERRIPEHHARDSATETLTVSLTNATPLPLPPRPQSSPVPQGRSPGSRRRIVVTSKSSSPNWYYALGTSAGLTAVAVAGQYYNGSQLAIESATNDAPPHPVNLAVQPRDGGESLTPTTVEPEALGDRVEAIAGRQATPSQAGQTRVLGLFSGRSRSLSLSQRTIAQVQTPASWQMQLAQRTQTQLEDRAHRFLQAAYDRAAKRDFASALAFLEQVPRSASIRGKADVKMVEYREKRNIQAEYWVYRAEYLSHAGDYDGAIRYLQQVAPETSAFRQAQERLAEYRQARDTQAEELLYQAQDLAMAGRYAAANQVLRMVPQATPSYPIAKDMLVENSKQLDGDAGMANVARQPD